MSSIVFICNFLFINYEEKNLEEEILIDCVALDMAFEDFTKINMKKEKADSPNNNSKG